MKSDSSIGSFACLHARKRSSDLLCHVAEEKGGDAYAILRAIKKNDQLTYL